MNDFQSLTSISIHDALAKLASGEISSLELTQAYLERISLLDPEIKAYLTISSELAITQAKATDRLRKSTKDQSTLPSLLGIPIAIKDVLAVDGLKCTCGSRILENYYPPFNATTVQRLLDAGVVILGKTNMDEFAMGSSTENSAYFTTRNPWNYDHVPGGSSGGSAAAVAARLSPAALGSDTGGSVRQPASFCGVTGIKPTYGRCSRFGLIAYGSSLDSVGVFGKDARDVALIYEKMAGVDSLDATSMGVPLKPINLLDQTDLHGIRIGVPKEYFIAGIQPSVEQAVRKAVSQLESMGAMIREVSLPHTKYALPVYYLIAPAEASANLARYDGIRFGFAENEGNLLSLFRNSRGKGFGSEVKRRIMLGTYALSAGYYDAYYGQAQKVRTLIKQDFEQVFQHVDVLATPVAPTTAFKIGEHSNDPLAMYLEDVFTLPINLAGVPGIAFPVGFDESNLPIGIQLIGSHFREDQLFQIAHAYQLTTDWHKKLPVL